MGQCYGFIKRYHFSMEHYQRSCDSCPYLVIIIPQNKLFRLGITCPLALGKMLISTFILTLFPRPINMYFLKYKKQIHFNHEQVKASGEPIQKWGKSKLVSWFQQSYTIRPVLPACHFRINVLWEEVTQMLP